MEKVVVTGYGMLSPLGLNASENWQALSEFRSGIRSVADCQGYDEVASKIAGRVWGYDPLNHFKKKELKRYDPFMQYALTAAREAMQRAGLVNRDSAMNLDRAGVVVGSGIGGLSTIESESE